MTDHSSRLHEREDVLVRRAAARLGLQAAAFVSLVVVLVTGAATLVLLKVDERAANDLLDATVALADDVEDPPLDTWLVILGDRGPAATVGLPVGADDPSTLGAVAAGAPLADSEHWSDGVRYRVRTERRTDGVTVQAVLDLTAGDHDRDQVLAAMMITGAAGLVLAAALGTWLSTRTLRPLSSTLALQRRFITDASHELRTPLTLLGTRAQLLRHRLRRVRDGGEAPLSWRSRQGQECLPGARVAELALHEVEGVVTDCTRLTAILEDLLLAADPMARRTHEPVDVTGLCREAVQAATANAASGGVSLTGPAPGTPVLRALGSATALHRAVAAVIDNAVRHARRAVSVAATSRGHDIVVTVTDDGVGVDPSVAPRLFARFATTPPTRQTAPRRYGLGLALVAEIAAAHGGRVELLDDGAAAGGSDLQRQTILQITLPFAPRQREGHRDPGC